MLDCPDNSMNAEISSTMTPPKAMSRLPQLLDALEAGLLERRQVVRMVLLIALTGEHTLLIGPPGTAKSELARRIHRAFTGGRYFERLLTRFSVPEELFGPLSISALENDRYERQTAGFLPDASIAFIDEVFKANSAILNALLTLLNEREFDNGAGRQRCPLISVIGATNAVPADEVGEAFFDRFLARVPVAPVSHEAFPALLSLDEFTDSAWPDALDENDRAEIALAARRVALPQDVAVLLAELRTMLSEAQSSVSDRRWVKIVRLLKTAAATEGRQTVSLWDLSLLPACLAPDLAGQLAVRDWLASRLGVREALQPPRLTRVVEAFEAQLEIEQQAEDLEYDEHGRLSFTAGDDDLAAQVGDAKGGSAAPRLRYSRRRRYGRAHIGARTTQIDALAERIRGYVDELANVREDLAKQAASSLWLDPEFISQSDSSLQQTADVLASLLARTAAVRAGFTALPQLDAVGAVPEPISHEILPA